MIEVAWFASTIGELFSFIGAFAYTIAFLSFIMNFPELLDITKAVLEVVRFPEIFYRLDTLIDSFLMMLYFIIAKFIFNNICGLLRSFRWNKQSGNGKNEQVGG